MCFPCCFIVSTAEAGFIERFGQFNRLAQPGFNFFCFPCEKRVGLLSFRVQQLSVRVETKTLDNVFLTAVVSVQYQVLRDKTFEAFYSLTNPQQQITAHVYDVSTPFIVYYQPIVVLNLYLVRCCPCSNIL
jgi:regulator of protease activity HflC (stomatin/prohibitin superfamily)